MSTLAMFIAFHTMIPTLPIYITTMGGSTSSAGLALALLTFSSVIIRPVTGWALDNFGRKKIFLAGLLFFLLPTLFFYWLVPVSFLLGLRFLQGFGWGICSTSNGTVASDLIPQERIGEGMGYFSLTSSISLASAPALGLWLIGQYSFQTLFLVCIGLTLLSIILATTIKYKPEEKRNAKLKFSFIEINALRPALVILFITMTYSALLSFLALFTLQQGLETAWIFFLVLALTSLVTRPLSGRIVDIKGAKGYDFIVAAGISALVIAMPVLAQTTSALHLVVGGLFYGIGFGFTQPTMLALTIQSVPIERRGAANATYWSAFDVGVVLGSVIWGVVANIFNYTTMFNLTVIPALLAMIVYFAAKKPPSTPVEAHTLSK
jgi:MFS family permease